MSPRRIALSLLAAAVAVGASLAPAAADDNTVDPGFEVHSVSVDRTEVSVNGLGTAPVTITMTTRSNPGRAETIGRGTGFLTLDEGTYPPAHALRVPLRLVSQDGDMATWRGTAHIGGPSRTVSLNWAHNCLVRSDRGANRCAFGHAPLPIPTPRIAVTAVNTPVITVDATKPVDLGARAYTVTGRVTSTRGRSYGTPLTVVLGRGDECQDSPSTGVPVVTGRDGRFRLLVTNRDRAAVGNGAPIAREHCVSLQSDTRDSGGMAVFLARTTANPAWTTKLQISPLSTVKLGTQVWFGTQPSRIPAWTRATLQRLDGRTWRAIETGYAASNGRIPIGFTPTTLGRATYRVRVTDTAVTTAPFTMTTVR